MRTLFHFTRADLRRLARDCLDEYGTQRRKAALRWEKNILNKYGAKNLAELNANYLDEVGFLLLKRRFKGRKFR